MDTTFDLSLDVPIKLLKIVLKIENSIYVSSESV